MYETIKSRSTAVRTKCSKLVKSFLQVDPDLDSVRPYQTNIKEWLKPVIDLKDFYVYPTNGITEGLNWWLAEETRAIKVYDGDYPWVKPRDGDGEILYMSSPSSIDGNWKEIPKDIPVALDLAYVGSTKIKKLDIGDNVEYVFYSFSKAFGVRNIRTGWLFSRKRINRLELLNYDSKYYNYFANDCSEVIMDLFDIEFTYNLYAKEQKRICDELNFEPSDSVHICTTTSPEFEKFRRSGNVARICISEFFNEET